MAKNGTTLTKYFYPEAPKSNPMLFNGNVYLLIGKKTYSAAAILAATFKHYKLGTLVGEETGEPTTFTANTVELTLPKTKLVCSVSTSKFYIIGTHNDGRGIIPDLAYKSVINPDRDELLEYVISKIRAH